MIEILILALLLGCIPGAIAQSKGYGFVGFWLYGAALFIVALPHSLLLKSRVAVGPYGRAPVIGPEALRQCPHCAETVRREAVICRFCQRDLPPLPPIVNIYAGGPSYYDPSKPRGGMGATPLLFTAAGALAIVGIAVLAWWGNEPEAVAPAQPPSGGYTDGLTCDRMLARSGVSMLVASGLLRSPSASPSAAMSAPSLTATLVSAKWKAMTADQRQRAVAAIDCSFADDGVHLLTLKLRDEKGRPLATYRAPDLVDIRRRLGPRA